MLRAFFAKSFLLAACCLSGFSPLCLSATIEPSDLTGSFGTDPVAWGSAYTPNSVATTRTTVPWNRPTSLALANADKTTFQAWDVFAEALANGTNPPNNPGTMAAPWVEPFFNPNGTANVSETTGTAFIPGSGNIYSPSTVTAFSISVPNYNQAGMATNYLLQLRTQGTNPDFASFLINGLAVSSLPNYSLQELIAVPLGGFGGTLRDFKLEFTLPSNNALDTLTFAASGSSMSLDKVFIDTQVTSAIPEPSTWALSLLGLGGSLYFARRKRIAASS